MRPVYHDMDRHHDFVNRARLAGPLNYSGRGDSTDREFSSSACASLFLGKASSFTGSRKKCRRSFSSLKEIINDRGLGAPQRDVNRNVCRRTVWWSNRCLVHRLDLRSTFCLNTSKSYLLSSGWTTRDQNLLIFEYDILTTFRWTREKLWPDWSVIRIL